MEFTLPGLLKSGANYIKKQITKKPATFELDPNAAAIGIKAPLRTQTPVAPTAPAPVDPAAQGRRDALNQQAAVSAGFSLDTRRKMAAGQTLNQIVPQQPQVSTANPVTPDLSQLSVASAPVATPPIMQQPPQTPIAPTVEKQPTNLDQLEKKYAENLAPSAEELAVTGEMQNLNEAERQGILRVQEQPIALDFITGQQAAIERRALAQRQTLAERAAIAQAKRQMALESSKFALEREDKKQAEQTRQAEALAKEQQPRFENVGGNLVRIDANGTVTPVYTPPAEGITPYQAEQLALEREKMRASTTAGTTPNVEQAKAQQFAMNASQANNLLASVDYDPGLVESGLVPNALKSSERQQFEQASRAFVNAVLRRESGATITDDEFNNKFRELIPQAGDSKEVKEQKAQARKTAIEGILGATSAGFQLPSGQQTPSLTPQQYETIRAKYPGLSDEQINKIMSGKTSDLSMSQNGSVDKFKQSIIQQESGKGGNYKAVGQVPAGYSEADRALGKYQIVPKYHFGKIGLANTPENRQKFLNSPQLQDKLFGMIIDENLKKYNGNLAKAAAAYYGGSAGAAKVGTKAGDAPQMAGGKKFPSINEYVNSVLGRIS